MTATEGSTRSTFSMVVRVGSAIVTVGLLMIAIGMVIMVATGHRPIIITTGSMRPAAPPGTLIIAGPKSGIDVVVEDVVVMRRPGATPVTHRVVEIVDDEGVRAAITQGDANDFLDPAPYLLGEQDELVARWYLPGLGGAVEWLGSSRGATALLTFVLVIVTSIALRRIWAVPDDEQDGEDDEVADGAEVREPVRSGGVL